MERASPIPRTGPYDGYNEHHRISKLCKTGLKAMWLPTLLPDTRVG